MQSKKHSLIEQCVSTAIKFVFALVITSWVIWPLIESGVIKHGDTFIMTCIFTVSSLTLGYALRRFFNGRT